MTQRAATWERCGGRCVGCGVKLPLHGDSWQWQAHHALKAQTLRRRGVPAARLRDATYTVAVCKRCHERHENRFAAIPLERLPADVVAAIDALGTWAQDLLRRYHPATGTAAAPRHDEGNDE